MIIYKHISMKNYLRSICAVMLLSSVSFGIGTAEFSASSMNVAENVSGGYVDITIQGDASGGTIGLLGIRYKSTSLMTAKYNGGTFSDDADNIYNAAALGTDSNNETDNIGTDVQVYFSGEASLTISIKIDDDNRWEGGPSGTPEYLAIELYEPGGAVTVAPGNPNGDGNTNTSLQINIVDNEATEPVLSFYNASTTKEEHDLNYIYIVVDGDIGIGDVGGVAPTFTWEIVQGSANAAIVDEMKNLRAKGVSVITVDGDVNKGLFPDARPYYIGTDNIVGGRLLGRAAKKLLESRGKDSGGYVQFAGFTDNDNARKRMDGFKDSIGERYSELDRMPDEMDLSKARNNVRTALVNHPDLTALVGIWAYNAPAIAEVAEERGVRDQVTVVTFDAQAAAIQHMIDGHIDAMVVQNPFEMGIRTVKLLLAMVQKDDKTIQEMFPRSGEAAGDVHTTGLRLIIPDNDSPLKAEDFEVDGIEFLPLEEFRVWLDTYNLSSS